MTQEEQAKELRREYKRQWNAQHKDKLKEYQTRYWMKLAARRQQEQAQPDGGRDELDS